MSKIDTALDTITLYAGAHEPGSGQMCVMEATAFIAGEPWTKCVCPTIASFMRAWSDGLPSNAERDRLLKPLIPKLIGTKGSDALAERRSYMAIDWFIRVYTPAFLRLTPSLVADGDTLAAMPPITDLDTLKAQTDALRGAQERAAAARDAVWAAAGDAARDAVWAAAGDAAGDAAWAAAGDAAGDAAWAAAGKALAPTVSTLQESAVALVLAMCELKESPDAQA